MPKGGVKAQAAKEVARTGLGNAEDSLLPASLGRGDPGATAAASAAAGGMAAAASSAGARALLKDLGELVVGKVLRRPSASVRTPYVADVQLASGEPVLAHTPAMDCAGLIVPGAVVRMTANAPRKAGAPPTKTTHAIQIAEEPREGGASALVGAHPALAEAFAEHALERRLIPELGPYARVLRQQTFGSTRVDFVLQREDGGLLLLEVKNVVCADYPEGGVPEGRSKVGVYTSPAKPYVRTAIFPHGAQKKAIGVVSDRAIKHLHELTLLQRQGAVQPPPRLAAALSGGGGGGGGGAAVDADGRVPAQAAVLFVVNRPDCEAFRPCHEACPMLARVLRRAEDAGVAVLAYSIDWEGGKAFWGRRLPVVYGADVSGADVDAAHLARILEFNATDPRTHWKADRRSPKASPAKSKAAEKAAEAEAIEAGAPEVEDSLKPKGKRRAAKAGKREEGAAAGVGEEGVGVATGGGSGAKKRGAKRAAAAEDAPAPATPEQPARRRGLAVAGDGGALLDSGGPATVAAGSRAKRTRTSTKQ